MSVYYLRRYLYALTNITTDAYSSKASCDGHCGTFCAESGGYYYCCLYVNDDGNVGGINGCCVHNNQCSQGYFCDKQGLVQDDTYAGNFVENLCVSTQNVCVCLCFREMYYGNNVGNNYCNLYPSCVFLVNLWICLLFKNSTSCSYA